MDAETFLSIIHRSLNWLAGKDYHLVVHPEDFLRIVGESTRFPRLIGDLRSSDYTIELGFHGMLFGRLVKESREVPVGTIRIVGGGLVADFRSANA